MKVADLNNQLLNHRETTWLKVTQPQASPPPATDPHSTVISRNSNKNAQRLVWAQHHFNMYSLAWALTRCGSQARVKMEAAFFFTTHFEVTNKAYAQQKVSPKPKLGTEQGPRGQGTQVLLSTFPGHSPNLSAPCHPSRRGGRGNAVVRGPSSPATHFGGVQCRAKADPLAVQGTGCELHPPPPGLRVFSQDSQ